MELVPHLPTITSLFSIKASSFSELQLFYELKEARLIMNENSMFYLLTGGGEGLQDDSLNLLTSSQTAVPPHLPQTPQGEDASRLGRPRILHLRRKETGRPLTFAKRTASNQILLKSRLCCIQRGETSILWSRPQNKYCQPEIQISWLSSVWFWSR